MPLASYLLLGLFDVDKNKGLVGTDKVFWARCQTQMPFSASSQMVTQLAIFCLGAFVYFSPLLVKGIRNRKKAIEFEESCFLVNIILFSNNGTGVCMWVEDIFICLF